MSLRRIEEIYSYLEAKEKKMKDMYLEKQYQLPLRLDKFLLYNNLEEIKGNAHKFGYDINKPCNNNLYYRENQINSHNHLKEKKENSTFHFHKPNKTMSNYSTQMKPEFRESNENYLQKLNSYVINISKNSKHERKNFDEATKISNFNFNPSQKGKLEINKLISNKNHNNNRPQKENFDIKISNKDIELAIRLIKGRLKESLFPKNKDKTNIENNPENTMMRLKDKKFKLLSKTNFIYKANSIFQIDSPLRVLDDASFFLKFDVTHVSNKNYSIKFIDLTRPNFPFVLLETLAINNQKRIIVDGDEIANPIKVFNWIKSSNDLIGSCIRFEISQVTENIETKYLFFENFRYENYIIAVLEIASYEKYLLCDHIEKRQLNLGKNDLNNQQNIISDSIKSTLNDLTQRNIKHYSNTNALRFLVDKMYLLKTFTHPSIIPYSVYIKGPVVIEFKDCTILSFGIKCFGIIQGNINSQLEELNYHIEDKKICIDIVENIKSKIKLRKQNSIFVKANKNGSMNNSLYKKPTSFKLPGEMLRNLIRKAIETKPDNVKTKIIFSLENQKDYIHKIPTVTAALVPKEFDISKDKLKAKNISKSIFESDSNLTKSHNFFQSLNTSKGFSPNNGPFNFLLQGKNLKKLNKDNGKK